MKNMKKILVLALAALLLVAVSVAGTVAYLTATTDPVENTFTAESIEIVIREHGKNEKGEFWSKNMNSFNHYAYGAVADWVYEEACGIKPLEAGFKRVLIDPMPTDKLDYLCASIDTKQGKISSKWYHQNNTVKYEISTPVPAIALIDGKEYTLEKGSYTF